MEMRKLLGGAVLLFAGQLGGQAAWAYPSGYTVTGTENWGVLAGGRTEFGATHAPGDGTTQPDGFFGDLYTFEIPVTSGVEGVVYSLNLPGVSSIADFTVHLFDGNADLVASSGPAVSFSQELAGGIYELYVSGMVIGDRASYAGWTDVLPVPAPSAGALLLAGLATVALRLRRRTPSLPSGASRFSGQRV